jgi:hypothetical protein
MPPSSSRDPGIIQLSNVTQHYSNIEATKQQLGYIMHTEGTVVDYSLAHFPYFEKIKVGL